ncbi:MAG: hypothetical protein HQK49_19870 [Oligoflexia bacterium]|nr:hypothetical protein [Oligoflexia bacterium]
MKSKICNILFIMLVYILEMISFSIAGDEIKNTPSAKTVKEKRLLIEKQLNNVNNTNHANYLNHKKINSAPITKKLDQKEYNKKREEIKNRIFGGIKELSETEESYLNKLNYLKTDILINQGKTVKNILEHNHLNPIIHDNLLQNLELIIEFSNKLSQTLKSFAENPSKKLLNMDELNSISSKVTDALAQHATYNNQLKIIYVTNQSELKKYFSNSKDVTALTNGLVAPIQRISIYPITIKEVINDKTCSNGNTNKDDLIIDLSSSYPELYRNIIQLQKLLGSKALVDKVNTKVRENAEKEQVLNEEKKQVLKEMKKIPKQPLSLWNEFHSIYRTLPKEKEKDNKNKSLFINNLWALISNHQDIKGELQKIYNEFLSFPPSKISKDRETNIQIVLLAPDANSAKTFYTFLQKLKSYSDKQEQIAFFQLYLGFDNANSRDYRKKLLELLNQYLLKHKLTLNAVLNNSNFAVNLARKFRDQIITPNTK